MTIPLTMRRLPLLAVIAAFSTGCFGPPTVNYDMIPVEGSITFEGEPLANAEVMFDSADFPRGFGTTDENGRFKVITRQFGAGLPAGTYRVSGVGRVSIDASAGPLSFDLKAKPPVGGATGGEGA